MSTWCEVSIWKMVAITIVLVVLITLTGFGAILSGKVFVGTALGEGVGWVGEQ